MFVLPPPPRYMGVNGQYGVGTNPMMPPIETNNLIVNPTGPEWQFLVGEGTYVLKEDILLSTPPPHPSELAVPNPNPLATNPQPETAGTKISLLNTGFTSTPALFSTTSQFPSNGASSSILEHPNEGRYSEGGLSSDGGCASTTSDTPASVTLASAPAFGEGNSLLTQAPLKDVNKRKKPKNNMSKSNSSFISRVIVNDTLTRKLVDRPADGLFAFANINRAFQWLDLSSPVKQDYLTKILFTKATCLCHNVNLKTKSPSHTDVIMGFSTGEIIWWEPFSQRYTRLNKNGIINNTPVSDIKWIPGSECLFLAAHLDGSLVVYDKEKDDVHFNPEEEASNPNDSEAGDSTSRKTNEIKFQIRKSVHSKNQKTNPVAVWKLSNQRIKGFAFSPDNRHLAVVSEDGTLRTIDYLKEELLDIYYSYYGGLSCVCWSPDGKYVVTGGQDDLISIWSLSESALVARCQGHQSWISAVVFDPWRCDDRNYRFGSVGEDGRLCLWDFNVGMLYRPRAHSVRHRGSISSRYTAFQRNEMDSSRLRSSSNLVGDVVDGVEHPVEPRAKIPMLPPVLNKMIDTHPASWLDFTEDSIMTSCKSGHIRTWNRPGTELSQTDEQASET